MALLLDENAKALIKVFEKAENDLIETIIRKEAKGSQAAYEKSLLAQVQNTLNKATVDAAKWAQDTIPRAYKQSVDDTVAAFKGKGINVEGFDAFSRLHTKAIGVLTRNTVEDLSGALFFVGRQIKDSVRQAGLDAIAQKVATGQTVKQAKANLLSSLEGQGLSGIRDKRGRLIRLDAYASLVARSTTRETTNTALLNQTNSLGYDLVQMSSHATSCGLCSNLQGRIYSISGTSQEYPALYGNAFGSHANVHPNCRHVLVPYIPELDDDVAANKALSNKPFGVDERSKEEIERYNARQNTNRLKRIDRNQYTDFKLALGDKMPKSLAGFKAMKRANGANWKALHEEFKAKAAISPAIEPKVATKIIKVRKPKKEVIDASKYTYIDKFNKDIVRDSNTLDNMPTKLVDSIEYYTTSAYRSINRALRHGSTDKFDLEKISDISAAINQYAGPLSQDTVVLRHMDLNAIDDIFDSETRKQAMYALRDDEQSLKDFQKRVTGAIMQDKAFLSTSHSKGVFVHERGVEIQFLLPKGYDNGLFIDSISDSSGEDEYLINNSQKFKIINSFVDEVQALKMGRSTTKVMVIQVAPVK